VAFEPDSSVVSSLPESSEDEDEGLLAFLLELGRRELLLELSSSESSLELDEAELGRRLLRELLGRRELLLELSSSESSLELDEAELGRRLLRELLGRRELLLEALSESSLELEDLALDLRLLRELLDDELLLSSPPSSLDVEVRREDRLLLLSSFVEELSSSAADVSAFVSRDELAEVVEGVVCCWVGIDVGVGYSMPRGTRISRSWM